MASKKFEKGSLEFQWFGDFWAMVQSTWIVEQNNDDYWQFVVDAVDKIYCKYKNNTRLEEMTVKLCLAYIDFLEPDRDSAKQAVAKYAMKILGEMANG